MAALDWKKLLIDERFPKSDSKRETKESSEHRTSAERDYDRILFSAAIRRLSDKTQVFPLEPNDSVRTRLTHSYEVSNLCRSMGHALVYNSSVKDKIFSDFSDGNKETVIRKIPSMLAAAGLAHDLGNPPFGHQGETAIGAWFKKKNDKCGDIFCSLTGDQKYDFLYFEGNAQTIRLVTRLQQPNDTRGLNLTYGTISALIKYPWPSSKDKKKFGYFYSEEKKIESVYSYTGLEAGKRHPLSYIMEACDDIAYSVLDVEDSIKKALVSVEDLLAFLNNYSVEKNEKILDIHKEDAKKIIDEVVKSTENDHKYHQTKIKPALSHTEINDVSAQKFRVHAISRMVVSILEAFEEEYDNIKNNKFNGKELFGVATANGLKCALKDFASSRAYRHRSVIEKELKGYGTIQGLMDYFWDAIKSVEANLTEGKKTLEGLNPFQNYVYHRISENYRRIYEMNCGKDVEDSLNHRYHSLQLITDMISGMSDNYAINLYSELKDLDEKFHTNRN